MRELTKLEIENIKNLTTNSVELGLLQPTRTALSKSILDATIPFRNFLIKNGIHNYNSQGLGRKENGIVIPVKFILDSRVIKTKASLYRPKTKKGDPRIWFSSLSNYCRADEILGITWFSGNLVVINLTQMNVGFLISDQSPVNPLKDILPTISKAQSPIAKELLGKMKRIAKLGFVPADIEADTGVGRTLEKLLGVPINSSKTPDYKGIELKSFRSNRKNRKNLFTQVADWNLSLIKSSREMVETFGYPIEKNLKLYCTVQARIANSQGLRLKIDEKNGFLFECYETASESERILVWKLRQLQERLIEKHSETFWVSADTKTINGKENFHFKKIEHTKSPYIEQLPLLIGSSIITMDHMIKKSSAGEVNEKGPAFKIRSTSLNLLFPPSTIYCLT